MSDETERNSRMNDAHQFTEWFVRATGNQPYSLVLQLMFQ